MAAWMPLAEALSLLERKHGVRLHQANLTARKGKRDSGSIMEGMQAEGLARKVTRGSRQFWEINEAGVSRLAEIASTARPGPPPGAQVTLNAQQLALFVAYLSAQPRPADALREALFVATGLKDGVDRIVIPISPRHPVLISDNLDSNPPKRST